MAQALCALAHQMSIIIFS